MLGFRAAAECFRQASIKMMRCALRLWVPEDPKHRHRTWIIGLVSREGAIERRHTIVVAG